MVCLTELTPDGPTARQWAITELSRADYVSFENPLIAPLAKFFRWIGSFFQTGTTQTGISWTSLILMGGLMAVIVLAVILRPVLLRKRVTSQAVFDEVLTLNDLRAQLRVAVTENNWSQAVIAQFRIIVKLLEQRNVLTDSPGLTALEAAQAISTLAPITSSPVLEAARTFNNVRYGDHLATQSEYLQLVDTEETLKSVSLPQKVSV